jgi:phosphonate transport system substrate-binding protein
MFERLLPAVLAFGLVVFAPAAYAADACKNRGELDAMYCDANNDMVADPPADSAMEESVDDRITTRRSRTLLGLRERLQTVHYSWRNVSTRRSRSIRCNRTPLEIGACDAFGRSHVAEGFSTGPTAFAVNLAVAPFLFAGGTAKEFRATT